MSKRRVFSLKVVYAFMAPTIKAAKIALETFILFARAVIKTLEKNGKFLLRGLICFACSLKKKLDLQASCHVISNFLSVKIRQIFSPNLCWENPQNWSGNSDLFSFTSLDKRTVNMLGNYGENSFLLL